MTKSGIQLITEERQRQIEVEGFSLEQDKQYRNDDLLDYAKFLLTGSKGYFPVGWDIKWYEKRFNRSTTKNIIAAGALLAAFLDDINNVDISKTLEDFLNEETLLQTNYENYQQLLKSYGVGSNVTLLVQLQAERRWFQYQLDKK